MSPPGGAGFAGVPRIAPGGVDAADAFSQTIGTTGATAATQTASGNPFTVEGDLRFPLEGMRNTSMLNAGFYDEFWHNSGEKIPAKIPAKFRQNLETFVKNWQKIIVKHSAVFKTNI